MITKVLTEDECKSIYTFTTWTEIKKEEASRYLQEGYYVHFGSYAFNRTTAFIVENGAIKWAKRKYGAEHIEILRREGKGYIYIRLI